MVKPLTDNLFWDQYWNDVKLPVEIKEIDSTPYIKEILNIFNLYLPKDKNINILEIGGAPGGYLAYMAKNFMYNVSAIDYSEVGCKKTIENFKILNIPVSIYNIDIINGNLSQLPLFDIVYSIGLLEHFSEPLAIIEKHTKLIKPNGLLMLGVPCFLGINKLFLKILKPEVLFLA
ncbi:MAG: class I SAM-dependent methyltransferase [Anaerotruncus sp.]|nr:class I SAM-dependent methyltransferase [Anaerotruncus sp.]